MEIEILTSRDDVAEFLSDIIEHADAHRREFGFLSHNAYSDWALQEKIHVAVNRSGSGAQYLGHVIFGGSNLQGRIFQAYVDASARGNNVGKLLVESALQQCVKRGYMSVIARVATDLTDANKFWGKVGFVTVKVKEGGASTGRQINIRARDLKVPSLLDYMEAPTAPKPSTLGLGVDIHAGAPMYSFDLNVIFDVVKQRPGAEIAGKVFALAFENQIKLTVTSEFLAELERTSKSLPSDPILLMCQTLPQLSAPSTDSDFDETVTELAQIVFPNQFRDNKLSQQDISDLRHIATSIHHGVAGFITSEKALLRANQELWKKFSIEILAPYELLDSQNLDGGVSSFSGTVSTSTDKQLTIARLHSTTKSELKRFLQLQKIPNSEIVRLLGKGSANPTFKGRVAYYANSIAGVGFWDTQPNPNGFAEVIVCIEASCPYSKIITEHLIETSSKWLSSQAPTVISLTNVGQSSLVQKTAVSNGFRPADQKLVVSDSLQKIAFGKPVTNNSWPEAARQIEKISGVKLPSRMPSCENGKLKVPIETPLQKKVVLDHMDLENLLSPVLVLFYSRPCAIIPIQREHADDLLGTSNQFSMLDNKEAILRKVRTYFRTPRGASSLGPGTGLLFYESGKSKGRSAAIAIARVVSSRVEYKDNISIDELRDGVLDENVFREIVKGEQVLAISFDNIMALPKPVPFSALKKLDCADDSNLVTARAISSKAFESVISEGWKHDR